MPRLIASFVGPLKAAFGTRASAIPRRSGKMSGPRRTPAGSQARRHPKRDVSRPCFEGSEHRRGSFAPLPSDHASWCPGPGHAPIRTGLPRLLPRRRPYAAAPRTRRLRVRPSRRRAASSAARQLGPVAHRFGWQIRIFWFAIPKQQPQRFALVHSARPRELRTARLKQRSSPVHDRLMRSRCLCLCVAPRQCSATDGP